jgi:AmmeMemoRadiSam system protein B/AmmeMemoRadiSam system protein A
MTVRLPAHAGRFYPGDPATLTHDIDGYLREEFHGVVPATAPVSARPKALVVPHAGYMFSGPVAGAGYAQLAEAAGTIRRVVLLGPAHYVPVASIATTGADVWRTPLGDVPVDDELRRVALTVPGVIVDDEPHAPEHSLEVHLPFLQRTLGDFRLLPLVVGRADPGTVAALLDAVWGGPETLVVVSTDLSHYLDHDTAATRDRSTAERILGGRVDELDPYDACGAHPLRGLMVEADRKGLRTRLVALCNSGDTAGPSDRVVGYGAFALEPAPTAAGAALDENRRAALLGVAVDAVAAGLRTGDELAPPPQLLDDPVLGAPGAAFVTLEREGRLLGCVGGLEPGRALAEAVARGAYAAAFEDPRLPAVDTDDYREMTVKVSVLSALEPFAVESYDDLVAHLRPGVDGVVVADRHQRATLLPSVWRQLPDPADFVAALWQKAGLPPGSWPEAVRLFRYTTVEFAEPGPRHPWPDLPLT